MHRVRLKPCCRSLVNAMAEGGANQVTPASEQRKNNLEDLMTFAWKPRTEYGLDCRFCLRMHSAAVI